MTRTAVAAGLVVFLGVQPHAAPQPEALARLRTALGGDAALSAVRTLRVRGTIDARPHTDHIEIVVALPDRFKQKIRIFRPANPVAMLASERGQTYQIPIQGVLPGTLQGQVSDSYNEQVTGFNRLELVPAPSWYDLEQHPEDVPRRVDRVHARFAEFVLPLLAGTSDAYQVDASSEANVVTFSAANDRTWRMELDTVTNLPARMSWTTPVRPGATAAATEQRWQVEYSEFTPVGGLRWPHHVVTWLNDELWQDLRIRQYEWNVALPDKAFR
jgi:hypothetical protein